MKIRFGVDIIDEQEIPPTVAVFTENVGGCAREFAITAMRHSQNSVRNYYFSLTNSVEEIKEKIALTFPKEDSEEIVKKIRAISFEHSYFRGSIIPLRWIDAAEKLENLKEKRSILEDLIVAFDGVERNSFVFFDSLTDLVRLVNLEIRWKDLIDFIKSLKKLCRKKDVLAAFHYVNSSHERESELLDQFEIVLDFELSYEKGELRRWMYVKKFAGIMPFIERSGVSRFEIKLDPFIGAIVSRVHRVI